MKLDTPINRDVDHKVKLDSYAHIVTQVFWDPCISGLK